MQTLLFRVYLKKELVQVKQFNKDQVVMGRNADLDIVLTGDLISPIHALVEKRDSGYYLCDLGSEAGVLVQGKKVLDSPIHHGDEFIIGPFTIQFYEGLPKPKEAPAGAKMAVPPAPTSKPEPRSVPAAPPAMMSSPDFSRPQSAGASKGTFLPAASFKSASEILQSSSGSVVEVAVTWRERVINTYHFREKQIITAGFDKAAAIRIPPLSQMLQLIPIIVIGDQVSILLFPGMQGELHSSQKTVKTFDQLQREGRISQGADGRSFFMSQKELVKIEIPNTELNLWVRFVPETPIAELAPSMDFSPSEFTALIVSLVVALLLYFYAQTFTRPEDETPDEEKIATFVYKEQPKPEAPMVENPVKDAPIPTTEKKNKAAAAQTEKKDTDKAKTAGKAAEVAPKPKVKATKPVLTSTIKPSKKPGASTNPGGGLVAKEKPAPDVSKLGLFADMGVQKSLEGAKETGALTQVGSAAAREAGERGQRPGSGLNVVRTKEGPGGSGIAPIGIKGVGVDAPGGIGRKGGPGIGSGISKGDAKIEAGGQEESFGGMDKEAIRRVVREHINDLRTCYETELNRNPDLAGKLVLKWEIREGGRVGKVNAENRGDTIRNQRVIKCCESVLREWRFPEPPRGMVGIVVYPFVFQSN